MTKEEAINELRENFNSFRDEFIDGGLNIADITENEKNKLDLLTDLSYLFPNISLSILIKDILGCDEVLEHFFPDKEQNDDFQNEKNDFFVLISEQEFFKERFIDVVSYREELSKSEGLEQKISELESRLEIIEREKKQEEEKVEQRATKKFVDSTTYVIDEFVNGVNFKMIKVEGGTFQMGATSEQSRDAHDNERPVHSVTLSDYYIGETEVTQELWKAVMGKNPSKFKGDQKPVECVSWHDCQNFIKELNQLTGKNFRLPTEAEWEYAARGGNKSKGYKYSGGNDINKVAWYYGDSNSQTHDVKTKSPNELGIYDMSGNVFEWCKDKFGSYRSSSQTNPTGSSSGSPRVLRGGSYVYFKDEGRCYRVSGRDRDYPDVRDYYYGLRLAL